MEDWQEPTLEEEFAGRMDAADRAVRAEHDAAVRAEEATIAGCPVCDAPTGGMPCTRPVAPGAPSCADLVADAQDAQDAEQGERCPTCGARNPFHSPCQAPPGAQFAQ